VTDCLLHAGTVVDGGGAPPVRGDVLISHGAIAAVGRLEAPADACVVDCEGLVVAPGFIDAHSHSDLQVLENRPEKLRQGVTAEVVGNCGFSVFPVPEDRGPLYEFADGILCGGGNWGWAGAGAYLEQAARECRHDVNTLVGHGTLRVAVAGSSQGPLDGAQRDRMEGLLKTALEEGSSGFSTGLMYAPGSSAPFEELERLCRMVARYGKIYTTHMRDYSDRLVEAVDEQLELARRSGCRLQISHLQAVGTRNWPAQQVALDHIERAHADGLDVAFDCYPYTHGSTVLTQLLPQWALDGGIARLLERLRDPATRRRILAEADAGLAQGWDGIAISSIGGDGAPELIGKSIAAIAAERGCAAPEAAADLLIEYRGVVNMLETNQSRENLRQAVTHPLSNIISDGFYVSGRPHPRLGGTFPHLLGELTRRDGWLSLPEAVRKITSVPAERFGLARTGRLKPGFRANITVFDPERITSGATYQDPTVAPVGIVHVFRDGEPLFGAVPENRSSQTHN
jgi:N-acyl-D-amino-acid deacylase